ncbi:hypothetical protein F5Y08DRAFT_334946 [Xylaria arbuscula]|nr:hypothetical protein F5Y08DRAFT_334946 [Xylaria arbuscula]
MDIATRPIPLKSLDLPDPPPATEVEILGISTATCLLGFFLCYMLFEGLRMLFLTLFSRDTPKERDEPDEWSLSSLRRSRMRYDERKEAPYLTSAAHEVRIMTPWEKPVIMRQYSYTQIPARRKPLSRRPLLGCLTNSMRSTSRWKETTLDMEEG